MNSEGICSRTDEVTSKTLMQNKFKTHIVFYDEKLQEIEVFLMALY